MCLALVAAGPAARRAGFADSVTARLARVALVLGVLAVPAVLTDWAHEASDAGGYDYGAAWHGRYDGSFGGLLAGLEITLIVAGVLREFPVAVALEVLLGLSVLMVAPFLHGSARNQAFQADAAKVAPAGTKALPKAPPKVASASTWLLRHRRDRAGHRRIGRRLSGLGPGGPPAVRGARGRTRARRGVGGGSRAG